jgi:hypothetical protein
LNRFCQPAPSLRHLHDRPFQATQRPRQFHRIGAAIDLKAEGARTDHPGGNAAHARADPRIAGQPAGKAVAFPVALIRHA